MKPINEMTARELCDELHGFDNKTWYWVYFDPPEDCLFRFIPQSSVDEYSAYFFPIGDDFPPGMDSGACLVCVGPILVWLDSMGLKPTQDLVRGRDWLWRVPCLSNIDVAGESFVVAGTTSKGKGEDECIVTALLRLCVNLYREGVIEVKK